MVISQYLPSCSPAKRDARRRLPSSGSLGPRFPHLPRYYAPRRLPHCPSQGASLVARSPIPCPLRCVRGVPHGLMIWSKSPDHARAFGHPVPHSGSVTRRHVALPRSRVPLVKTCPALRPRWCPAHSPKRAQDCCLPATENRRLTTTLSISGLHHAAYLLATPGSVRPLTGRHAGSLLTCWLGFHQVGLAP